MISGCILFNNSGIMINNNVERGIYVYISVWWMLGIKHYTSHSIIIYRHCIANAIKNLINVVVIVVVVIVVVIVVIVYVVL